MWVIETKQAGQAVAWEITKSVPRNAGGDPVESGPLDEHRAVVGAETDVASMTTFLKAQSGDHVRVGDVEAAWKAGESGGPQRERTVKRRDVTAAQVNKPAKPMRSIAVKDTKGPSSPLTGVVVLLALAAAAYFIFTKLM